MFAISLKRFCYVGDKVIVRNLRNRKFPEKANPGLQSRINAFRKEGLKIDTEDAYEFVEQSDSDFYNVGEAYNEHLNQTLAGKLDLRHHIIKEKYFKENMPNLLTWSEKEQIRHLATTAPDEWTPEKIAQSFPITVSVAKKLLKYAWKPASAERIARHDESAMRNWRDLKEGNLDISEELRNHFLKFSERSIPSLQHKSIKIDLTQERKMGEFESIIRKCAAKEQTKGQKSKIAEVESTENDMKQQNSEYDNKQRVTFDQLADTIKNHLDEGQYVNMNDAIMVNTVNSSKSEQKMVTQNVSDEIDLVKEDKSTELTQLKEDEKSIKIHFTQRIRIPKKAYKKGATYKVNDCYYDDDGKFLYRVLGMN